MARAAPLRLIAHLDMDAFYASVELLQYPQLRGLPVVIGGVRHAAGVAPTDSAGNAEFHIDAFAQLAGYRGRGVVTTATYEARAFGVHSGMGLMKAARLAPHALLLPANFERYRQASRQFKAAVAELAPAIEDRGIDEIYIDLTEVPGAQDTVGHDRLGGARALAQEIKNNVRRACNLSCSIGIAPNKLLAKICSELDKPDGLTVITAADLESRIWPLPVRAIKGIGPKAGARLAQLGLHHIGALAACEPAWLQAQFGRNYGHWLYEAAHGHDERPVQTESEPVSMSRETTFERDLHPRQDRAQLTAVFTQLCLQVAQDLQRKGYAGRTIGIKLRFDDFRTVTRDHTLALATADAAEIQHTARECLRRVNLSRRLRLLGVRVGTLVRSKADGSPATAPAPLRQTPVRGSRRTPVPQQQSDTETLPLFDDTP
jgi:DNA polymerase-4